MRILLCSYTFSPNVGGIETMSEILAEEFIRAGHEVKVVTCTPGTLASPSYEVLRQPSKSNLFKAVKWSDVVLHSNISLQLAWPLFIIRKPWVIVHHTWIRKVDGRIGIQERLKRLLVRRAKQISISQAVADDIPGFQTLIGNCYNTRLFRNLVDVPRDRDLVFVGRLVSDKGADLAIDAVSKLRDQGLSVNLTIIGGGVDEHALKSQVCDLGLANSVRFTGSLTGEPLVREINRHKVMVVPSRWKEPFGIVALEGIACGCVVVGSDGGGLKEAIGECGLTFPNNDLEALTNELSNVLTSLELREAMLRGAHSHLERHSPQRVARMYLDELMRAVR